jgi:hypothetical protein
MGERGDAVVDDTENGALRATFAADAIILRSIDPSNIHDAQKCTSNAMEEGDGVRLN